MTSSSPEGPRERLAEHFRDLWAYEELNNVCWTAADQALAAVQPELDRLTAEVERLGAIAKQAEYVQGPEACFEQECEDFCNDEGEPLDPMPERCSHMFVCHATSDDAGAALSLPETIRQLEAERDSLRAQLDKAVVLPPDAEEQVRQVLYLASGLGRELIAKKLVRLAWRWRASAPEAAADELSSQGGDYLQDFPVCEAEHPEFGRCFISEDGEHGGQDYHESDLGSWPLTRPSDAAVAARSEATTKDSLEGRPSGSRAAEPQPVEAAVDNDLAAVLLDHYGFIPLSVRYDAAARARRVVELWRGRECPSPLSDSGKHHDDFYDERRFPCDWCGMGAPEVSASSLTTQEDR